ncbi:uncharacterized protein METZ01_LOCUS394200, partial [marine metagenome]
LNLKKKIKYLIQKKYMEMILTQQNY